MKYYQLFFYFLYFLLSLSLHTVAQPTAKKYQGLLWEITGNGLAKPSYLFGTMHVSNKLAFHLSDSFYFALKQVDAVALELNPDLWQSQMVRLATLNANYNSFSETPGNDYLVENSFKISEYEDQLKIALSTEPPVVNSLLYRSYKPKDDFEEDTFLDLYIFQAGRKLGKIAAGVEDYYQSEKLVLEAYRDMAAEKKKKNIDLDGETVSNILQKLQQAYRNADLDLMDSLDNKMEKSAAFREKFLYRRNEIQADAIDSILTTKSLFAGVGAAHLPGNRGVIELLRKKGYQLRPVKMTDRDAAQKEAINQLKVKVNFSKQYAEDKMYTVEVPGPLYALKNNYQLLNRTQYADMSNGAYYMVTRVKTYASFMHLSPAMVSKKTDSLLYEHVPGKILRNKSITRNGYAGFDIVNRTRRGDLQRYHIFITPYEVIIFKMSGKNDYAKGEEGDRFFNSIQLKEMKDNPVYFIAAHGGFGVQLPQLPHIYVNNLAEERWEYEAQDETTGDAFLILKKSVYNFNFLEADSVDLALIETSFRSAGFFDKQVSRKLTAISGYPALIVKEKMKNGDCIHAAFIIKGPHYYVLAQRTKNFSDNAFVLYRSLKWEPYQYPQSKPYADSLMHFEMQTPVLPDIDEGIRLIVEKTKEDAADGNNAAGIITYWKKINNAVIKSAATGEMISVQVQEYPRYFYIRDSVEFWQKEIEDFLGKKDMLLHSKINNTYGQSNGKEFRITIRDTGSSRMIKRLIFLKGKYIFTLSTLADTLTKESDFTAAVFNSIKPLKGVLADDLYKNKLSLFFSDLFSSDSSLQEKAQQAVSNIYFDQYSVPQLVQAINRIAASGKNYFHLKAKLIAELGYINDSVNNVIPSYLKKIYEQTADTSMFQNEAILALARQKTAGSFTILKELLLHDPPVFEDNSGYQDLFSHLADTLQLSASLFPHLMQLASLNDYKENILDLLVKLVDSGYIKQDRYAAYFPGIFIDAKVAWKKQKGREEKIMETDSKKREKKDEEPEREFMNNGNYFGLNDYAILLMPFYEENKNVQQFFSRMLSSLDAVIQMNTAVLLLCNKKEVDDSIFLPLAAKDKLRGLLFSALEKTGRLDKFPTGYKTQLLLAKSYLLMQNEYDKMDSVVFLQKKYTTIKNKSGYVYFFKYRIKRTDDWKIGISGLQPLNEIVLSSNNEMAFLTDKKIMSNYPLEEQLNTEFKKIVFSFYNSAKNFYNSANEFSNFKYLSDYESLNTIKALPILLRNEFNKPEN